MTRLPAPLLILFALAAPAAAQLTEAQASAELKLAIKQAKQGHAAAVAQRAKAATAAIDGFLAAAPSGVDAAFADLFEGIETFQNGLVSDLRVWQELVAQTGYDVLTELADGASLDGQYPDVFFQGEGGPLDDLRAAMNVTQTKALAKVRKRLEKAAAKLAKTSGARLSAYLELGARQGLHSFVQEGITSYLGEPLVIHTVLALGSDADPDSGTIRVGGVGDDAESITVYAANEDSLQLVVANFFEGGSPWWHATFDGGGGWMPDGNVLIFTLQGTSGGSAGGYVSVR